MVAEKPQLILSSVMPNIDAWQIERHFRHAVRRHGPGHLGAHQSGNKQQQPNSAEGNQGWAKRFPLA